MLSRELFEYRVAKGQGHEKDFLTVGSMGHASAIALGIAKFRSKRQVLSYRVKNRSYCTTEKNCAVFDWMAFMVVP